MARKLRNGILILLAAAGLALALWMLWPRSLTGPLGLGGREGRAPPFPPRPGEGRGRGDTTRYWEVAVQSAQPLHNQLRQVRITGRDGGARQGVLVWAGSSGSTAAT